MAVGGRAVAILLTLIHHNTNLSVHSRREMESDMSHLILKDGTTFSFIYIYIY